MKFWENKKGLLVILFLAAFVRFVGLSWGLPYHFHPDEWNMAAAITRLTLENKLDPQFYAYGQFPLYLARFSARIFKNTVTTAEGIVFLRFWSALAGLGTVYFVYLISKRFLTTYYSLLATVFSVFTPGLIQIAHFGTTESFLSFFFLAVIYFSLKALDQPSLKNFLLAAFFLGLALGSKITAVIFGLPLFLAFLVQLFKARSFKTKLRILSFGVLALALTLTLTLLTSPYLLLDFPHSRGTLLYETSVATGQSLVFYTRQFFNTIPVLFQVQKIFPYALGWPIFVLSILGLILMIKKIITEKNLLIANLLIAFGAYFFSQAFLFCKWTRFMAPLFAFFPIFAAITLSYLSRLRYLSCLVLFISLVPGFIFSSIYFRPDIRFQASEWIFQNIPSGSKVLAETGNVIDIPILPSSYPNYQLLTTNYSLSPISFDFYHLDENPELFLNLLWDLENSDYIFVPSRRIFANHQRLPEKYPLTARYHDLLFSGWLGFKEIKTFYPYSSSKISDEQSEETFTAFDHPVIRIYKKEKYLIFSDYEKLFKN